MHSTRTTAPRARTHTHTTPHLRRSTRTAARITSIRPEHDHPTQRRDTSAREPTSDFSFFSLFRFKPHSCAARRHDGVCACPSAPQPPPPP